MSLKGIRGNGLSNAPDQKRARSSASYGTCIPVFCIWMFDSLRRSRSFLPGRKYHLFIMGIIRTVRTIIASIHLRPWILIGCNVIYEQIVVANKCVAFPTSVSRVPISNCLAVSCFDVCSISICQGDVLGAELAFISCVAS